MNISYCRGLTDKNIISLPLNNSHKRSDKTKVLSVQLGKTLSFVKFVVEWGGVGWRGERGVKLWIVVH